MDSNKGFKQTVIKIKLQKIFTSRLAVQRARHNPLRNNKTAQKINFVPLSIDESP